MNYNKAYLSEYLNVIYKSNNRVMPVYRCDRGYRER